MKSHAYPYSSQTRDWLLPTPLQFLHLWCVRTSHSSHDSCWPCKLPSTYPFPFIHSGLQHGDDLPIVEIRDEFGAPVDNCGSDAFLCTCMLIWITLHRRTNVQHPLRTSTGLIARKQMIRFPAATWYISVKTVAAVTESLKPFNILERRSREQDRRIGAVLEW